MLNLDAVIDKTLTKEEQTYKKTLFMSNVVFAKLWFRYQEQYRLGLIFMECVPSWRDHL